LETSQNELDNERREKVEQLSSQSENYQKHFQELQQNLSEKDNERTALSERLNEVELDLKKAIDDHVSLQAKYETLIEERNVLVEQQALFSTER
jgi:chromosome segregation ATPase